MLQLCHSFRVVLEKVCEIPHNGESKDVYIRPSLSVVGDSRKYGLRDTRDIFPTDAEIPTY